MQIKLFANLQQLGAGRSVEMTVADGTPVREVLEALFERAPRLREHILEPDGQALLPHVNIMINGRIVRDLQGLDTPVKDSDTMAIFPPVAGG